ncbi:MAG: DUF4212 domain-containing protein [Comamonadaceae bacterium]|nr:MAG: DUF4212 domain-containing protein [Comamonadaceae bacterium]
MDDMPPEPPRDRRIALLKAGLLLVWGAASFGVAFFAHDLQFAMGPWPFGYWFAAQGAMLSFIAIVVAYAWCMNRLAPEDAQPPPGRDERG